jgi:hypothetical protein
MGPSTESNPHWYKLPTDSHRRHRRKGKEDHLHTKRNMKQILSNYAQQDWLIMTKRSRSRHMQGFKGHKGLVSLKHLPLYTFKQVLDKLK